MDKNAVISFSVFLLLCSTSLDSFAAVKTDRQNTNMQMMPREVYTAMQRLVDQGIVRLPAGCRNVRDANFDRHEMSLLTLQAMKRIRMDENGLVDGNRNYRLPGYRETLVLKENFNKELKDMGMGQEYLMNDISASSEASEQSVTKTGNIRSVRNYAIIMFGIPAINVGTGMTAAFARVYSWKPASMTTGTHSLCWKQTNTS